jgi:hypothetical protein
MTYKKKKVDQLDNGCENRSRNPAADRLADQGAEVVPAAPANAGISADRS